MGYRRYPYSPLAPGIVGVETRGHHDGAHLEVHLLVALLVEQGAGAAGPHALHAFGAHRALQTPLGLGDGLFLGVAVTHLHEAVASFGTRLHRHRDAGRPRDLGQLLVVGPGLGERVGPERHHLLAPQVVVDVRGGLAAGRDGLDGA